jgi:hypothetical protein
VTTKKILTDYKQQGKTFIPPFIHKLGPLQEIAWVETMIPELVWIALIQEHYGHPKGVSLITSMTRIARKCAPSEKMRIFATISSFREMTSHEQLGLQSELGASGELFEIQKSLTPLVVFYPECPLRFLFSTIPSLTDEGNKHLENFKTLVAGLYEKTSRNTMMVQATAVWLAFDSGVLKVFEGLSLANFPEIEKYPNTELSQRVAGSIRATVPMIFTEHQYPASSNWPRYFWNRGFEIDRCYFQETTDE